MRFDKLSAITLAAVSLLAFAGSARAQESVLDKPMDKAGWPIEITRRPLTLAPNMLEVSVPVGINLSKDAAGKPVFLAPNIYYGLADGLTIGLRHFVGVCLTGTDNGCPKLYNDASIDTIWRLYHGGGADLAFGAALNAAPISDPFTLSGEVRLIARFGGPIAFALAPTFNFGLNERDSAVVKTKALQFPLTTYGYGWVSGWPGNKEVLSVPVSLTFQVTPGMAFSLGSSIEGPLNPAVGSFSDYYVIPASAALVFSPSNMLDIGASFTFTNLLGKQVSNGVFARDRLDGRAAQAFFAFRL